MNSPNDQIISFLAEEIKKQCGERSPEAVAIESIGAIGDKRMLGNYIIKLFPWPIGVGIRKLFSVPDKNEQRLKQLLKIGEIAIQFFSYILLAQLWEQKKTNTILLTADFKEQINKLERPSFGVFAGLIRSINAIFEQNNIHAFTGHTANSFFSAKKFDAITDKLVKIRNDEGHYNQISYYGDVEELTHKILGYLSFLPMYKLVSVSDIRVLKYRLTTPRFKHVMRLLNNTHEDFDIESHDYSEFSESYAVFLLKDFTLPKKYLNLSPFLIDTASILQSERTGGIKNGIYMYGGMQHKRINYYLVNGNEKAAFNDLPVFSQIEAEFQDLKNTLEYEKSF